ncbi:MAG: AAA family ATPase, partial [Succinivibrionaceae bacterium]|nr:AAA family ATPase [Succinivibrionaceae bacterium]
KIKSRLFLSRPRRFGKSLVLDTIATLFEKGVEPYFKDTWIYDKWKEETYPVLRLNFIEYSNIDFQEFQNSFLGDIADFAQDLELKKFKLKSTISDTLKSLFKALVDRRIVILIDEYDAQLTANINNEELYNTFQQSLRDLYGTLKGKKQIKFLGITGVTRLKDVSIFSVGSDILDVSFHSLTASIVGFTREEIVKYYFDYLNLGVSIEQSKPIEEVTNDEREQFLNKIALEYNGYCFDEDNEIKVFSTWSVNSFFNDIKLKRKVNLKDYWYDNGGTPSILVNYLKTHKLDLLEFKPKEFLLTYDNFINPTSLQTIDQKTLLVQIGYLTLKSKIVSGNGVKVGLPNNEVYRALVCASFLKTFGFPIYLPDESIEKLKHGSPQDIIEIISSIIHTVPYDHDPITTETILRDLVYMFFVGARVSTTPEFPNSDGRSDLEIEFMERRIVFEFKYAKTTNDAKTKLTLAKKQIIEKDYGNHAPFKDYIRFALVYNGKTKKVAFFEEVQKNC